MQAAQLHFEAGDATRSTELFEEAIDSAPPGRDRARILFLCGTHAWMDLDRVGTMCERAIAEAEGDDELIAGAREHLAWVAIYRGDLRSASHHAAIAVRHAEAVSSSRQRAEAKATFGMVEFLVGRPAEAIMAEAERLQDIGTTERAQLEATVYTDARTQHGLQLLWAGELDASRRILEQELREQEQRGLYLVRDEVLGYLAELECRAGNWGDAARHADDSYEIIVEAGRLLAHGHILFNKALVEAHRGDVGAASSDGEEGLRVSIANGDLFYASCNRSVLGFVELSRSEPSLALEHLLPAVEYLQVMGAAEPGVIPCIPDAIECLVSIGELDETERLLHEHEQKGRKLDRPWAIATAGRCRGLVLAARGDVPAALEALDRALRDHERVRQPFELARTLLVKGRLPRRGKRRRAARETLQQALTIFESLGAPLWAERARKEIARVSGRRTYGAGELTPSERRIAELVADGKTNKEVAAILVVADRTVEGALTQIYRKLGVRSRTELARKLAGSG